MENHLIVVALSVMPSDDDVEKDHFTLDEIYYMSKEGEFTQSSPIAAQNPEITPTQSVNWLDWIHDELPEPSRRLFSTPYQLQYPPEPMRRSYRDALVSEVEIPNPATADVTHGLYSNAFLPGDLKDFKNGSEAGATRASSLEVNIPNLAIPYELCGPYSNAFPPEDLKDFENGSEAAATVASSLEVNIPDPATADVLTCPKCQKTFRGKYRRGTLARHKRLKHGVYSKS